MSSIEKLIAQTFSDIADGLETGRFGKQPKIAVTGIGSEHGEKTVFEGACAAARCGVSVTHIGTMEAEGVTTAAADTEEKVRDRMEELLASGEADGAVTMHYPFPIGVSTVGRVITPGRGKEMFVACTTGTSSPDRIEGMVKNAIYGIITSKACGIAKPTVGILNVDGARQTECILKQLKAGGYDIEFAVSERADGGCVMRGNDLLTGACDVMVTDPLTGNVMMKLMSAYTTGGSYEGIGYGYGPGIGRDYDKLIMIVSRASGAPVIANAIKYADQLIRGGYREIAAKEFAAADKAGLSAILSERKKKEAKPAASEPSKPMPKKEIVTAQIAGIEVADIEDAAMSVMNEGIYAESGMGCTGPIILVSDANKAKACEILKKGGYITE